MEKPDLLDTLVAVTIFHHENGWCTYCQAAQTFKSNAYYSNFIII